MNLFVEISLIVALATALSLVAKLLRQPLIVGYIATGIVVGPYVLNILDSKSELEFFSKIGIAILLFIVGLSLNPDVLKEVGKASLITGVGQVLFTSIIGFYVIRWIGFSIVPSAYIAIALTFSSTIIVLKLLSDLGDTDKLYGKISLGLLLVQDLVATLLLLFVSIVGTTGLGAGNLSALLPVLFILLAKGVVVSILLYLIAKFLLPHVAKFVASSQELLFIFSLAWGLGLSALFYHIGFSIEIGALIAGITLAASPFAYEIASRLKPLRDFFIMIFFIMLGSQLILSQLGAIWPVALGLSLFVLVGNPLIMIILMNLLGFRTRVAFMAGLTIAQISEFSLILVALGFSLGHISQEVVSMVTLVGVITIAGSSYLILHADKLYTFLKPALKLITWRRSHMVESSSVSNAEVIIFGYDRVGQDFVRAAKKITSKFLVVDFNPASIERLKAQNIPYCYGDAEDTDFLNEIGLRKAKLVVSTIPDLETNLVLTRQYRKGNSDGIFITISHTVSATHDLYRAGASYVVMPHHLGAYHAASLIEKYGYSSSAFNQERETHLSRLALQS
ncbi:cation:proton antiporter [Candidatus Parcubacteria bacterium]|nr:cation:proton antiporter [Candidatus Parcubacteria bacterium]